VYFKVVWHKSNSTNFDLDFYLTKCRLADDENEAHYYDIIKGGCASDLVLMQRHSDSYLNGREVRYSYKSFSFNPEITTYNVQMFCEMNFCLREEVENGTCGKVDSCPNGYSITPMPTS